MSALSDALAARRYERNEGVKQSSIYKGATRPAIDWIAQALPSIRARAKELPDGIKYCLDVASNKKAFDLELRQFNEEKAKRLSAELATLTALIAQAEGTEKEGVK